MDAITISAKFAAYTWFTETAAGKHASQQDAVRFSEENWERFLGAAPEGMGQLLARLAKPRKPKANRLRRIAAAG